MTTTYEDTVKLIEELRKASQAYYQDGVESELEDYEYDLKLEHLETLVDSYPELFNVGTDGFALLENEVAAGTKIDDDSTEVTRTIPMLSLLKAKTEDEVISYADKCRAKGAKSFTLQAKLDGFAASIEYKDGKLHQISTRGDGLVGEDVTYLATAKNLTIVGLPDAVSDKRNFEVRGELYFTDSQFESANAERLKVEGVAFKNSRNSITGLSKKAAGGLDYSVEFSFATYSLYIEGEYTDLAKLPDANFKSIQEVTSEQAPKVKLTGLEGNKALHESIEKFGEARENFTIPTDGVVIKPTNEAEMHKAMGATSHHPVSHIAFKYPDAVAEAKVLGIDVTVGKTGRVTPIARLEPTDLDGTVISNVSLHNFNLVDEKDIRVGSTVALTRANGVIPYVKAVLSNPADAVKPTIPSTCPVCGKGLESSGKENPPKLIQCKNFDCPSRAAFAIRTAVGKDYLDIDGLSEVLLDHLTGIGRVKTIADLFTLERDELSESPLGTSVKGNPRRLGEKRADNILEHIEKAKTKPLFKLLASLGVEALGRTSSKALIAHFGTLEKIQEASVEQISNLDGFAKIRAERITSGLKRLKPVIDAMQSHGVQFVAETSTAPTDSPVAGKSFAISGEVPNGFANRGQLVEWLESNGARFDSSPKADTDYMIGDPAGTSSKAKKATKLGIEFISPSEFASKFVTN